MEELSPFDRTYAYLGQVMLRDQEDYSGALQEYKKQMA
jgi:hypothetical protein